MSATALQDCPPRAVSLPRPEPSVKMVRNELPVASRERSTRAGTAYFALSALLYLTTFVAMAMASYISPVVPTFKSNTWATG